MLSKIRIKLKSFDSRVIDETAFKIVELVKTSGIEVRGPIPLPVDRSLFTVIRSVHKYKDSREQFEQKTHKRIIDIINPNLKMMDILSKIQLSSSVSIEIKHF